MSKKQTPPIILQTIYKIFVYDCNNKIGYIAYMGPESCKWMHTGIRPSYNKINFGVDYFFENYPEEVLKEFDLLGLKRPKEPKKLIKIPTAYNFPDAKINIVPRLLVPNTINNAIKIETELIKKIPGLCIQNYGSIYVYTNVKFP